MSQDSGGELAALTIDLEELLAERSIELARPMRGAERERLRRSYERAAERLRTRIAALATGSTRPDSAGSDER